MKKPKRGRSKTTSHRPLSQMNNVSQREQTQKDYEAFKGWIASGEADKPITADELNRMLLLAAKIK